MISNYYMPTKVLMGSDCVVRNSGLLRQLGRKALLVTGRQSAKQNGSEKDMKEALGSAGIEYAVFDRVMSNPTIACVYEGAALARENKVDFIIGIGGGSPMDAAKAIALLAAQDIEEQDLFSGNYPNKVLPMAFVPTTAGTGSEVTPYSILTNDQAQTKTSIASEFLFPRMAFLDARYTQSLSAVTTINTALDALSHAVEGMLSVKASRISDALAINSIRMIMECMPALRESFKAGDPGKVDLRQREILLQASLIAGMVIAQTGTTVVHAMGYSLTYFHDIDHGRANGLLLAEYLKLVEQENPELAGRILTGMNFSTAEEFKALTDELLGHKEALTEKEIMEYSRKTLKTKNMDNCLVKPDQEEIEQIYVSSFQS
ncbi:Alcohol dehydrogenase [Syntrophobotulus glycolicus DSM 8271]|uniref:Alcohol dehydrogenase n=1 Tax=Syntrophobotulus glycolicus (strain DSM 8271 / FlGlyR) TaxID=645991 RepID=F0SVX3_SYNGF|nr:iron-containing alcohol dehydrogenase family protein [Syntrophobotulus glycolicus]ADY55679.1 Alcohol dehydrogenase [Syntrophobotulus glycolicus DSM 8271]